MTEALKTGRSRNVSVRRMLISGAFGIAGAALLLPAAAWAADQPGATAQRRAWHERYERRERLHDDLIRDALRLTPEQQQAWQAIRAKREALRKARFQTWSQVRHALREELAKPEPDLARVAALRDAQSERNLQARKEIEDMRLKLYATFSPEQKAVVRDFLKARLARGERWSGHERGPRREHPGRRYAPAERS